MDQKVPESQTDQQLPMVVYLRGDEEYLEDFTIDAEDAMNLLGIKRSRLTQISGRELRVGRIRRDRYIRPVYRLKDIEDYQSWTRSTATHQSSSMAIEQAVDRLEEQCQQLEKISISAYQESLEQTIEVLKNELKKQDQITELRNLSISKNLNKRLQQLPIGNKNLIERIDRIETRFDQFMRQNKNDIGRIDEILTNLHREMIEVYQRQIRQGERLPIEMSQLQAAILENVKEIVGQWVQSYESRVQEQTLELLEVKKIMLDIQSGLLSITKETGRKITKNKTLQMRKFGFESRRLPLSGRSI